MKPAAGLNAAAVGTVLVGPPGSVYQVFASGSGLLLLYLENEAGCYNSRGET